jgi:hypothetical protein
MRSYRLVIVAVALCACAPKEVPVVAVKGECADLNKSPTCTWVHTQGGTLIDAGATIPIASIENAPATAPMAWPPVADGAVQMPAGTQAQTGFTELTTYWEPMGHPPGPYLTPHFDFHFYLVPAAEIAAMDCKDVSKPAALPQGFELPDVPLPPPMAKATGVPALIGLCVPQMGMHAMLGDELKSTTPFNGTMVIGYYKGKPIFIEPMLSKTMLMEKKSFNLVIPTIPGLTTVYPRKFRAEYDSTANAYHFTFSGFAAS